MNVCISFCLLRHDVVRVLVFLCVSFKGHFVMVPLNLTYLHCLQHSLYEHLFNLYCKTLYIYITGKKHNRKQMNLHTLSCIKRVDA